MLGARRLTCTFMLAALLLPLVAAAPLAAQSWPTRPVKFILTLGPGSGADIGARLLADRLTRKWDQPIVIENRPGGDGIVAINAFVSAQDDHVL
ncbi:MAG: tripartite tricarboxylate transporter substrate binding protein, partial [Alphaproteobacteria bacterium]